MDDENGRKPHRTNYIKFPFCRKTIHSTEKCWEGGAGAQLRPKKTRQDDKSTDTCNVQKTE